MNESIRDKTRFVLEYLGGYSLQVILREKGWTNEQIKDQLEQLVAEKNVLIAFMNSDGQQNYEALPPQWRDAMLVLTGLRWLVDKEGVDFMSIEDRISWERSGFQVNEMRLDKPRDITLKEKRKHA